MVFKLCETENLNFAVYFTIDKYSYEQVLLKVEPKSFLYEFLNSGDPLYVSEFHGISTKTPRTYTPDKNPQDKNPPEQIL